MNLSTTTPHEAPVAPARSKLARYLPTAVRLPMGALFLFSGVFGLLMAFGAVAMPQPATPQPEAATLFMTAVMKSYLFPLIKATEVAAALLLLSNRWVPLALVLLAPLVVNILAVHALLAPSGLVVAVAVFLAEAYLAWAYRAAYRPLFVARATPA